MKFDGINNLTTLRGVYLNKLAILRLIYVTLYKNYFIIGLLLEESSLSYPVSPSLFLNHPKTTQSNNDKSTPKFPKLPSSRSDHRSL